MDHHQLQLPPERDLPNANRMVDDIVDDVAPAGRGEARRRAWPRMAAAAVTVAAVGLLATQLVGGNLDAADPPPNVVTLSAEPAASPSPQPTKGALMQLGMPFSHDGFHVTVDDVRVGRGEDATFAVHVEACREDDARGAAHVGSTDWYHLSIPLPDDESREFWSPFPFTQVRTTAADPLWGPLFQGRSLEPGQCNAGWLIDQESLQFGSAIRFGTDPNAPRWEIPAPFERPSGEMGGEQVLLDVIDQRTVEVDGVRYQQYVVQADVLGGDPLGPYRTELELDDRSLLDPVEPTAATQWAPFSPMADNAQLRQWRAALGVITFELPEDAEPQRFHFELTEVRSGSHGIEVQH